MNTNSNLNRSFNPVALIFGVSSNELGWVSEESLLPLAGGGSAGRRCINDSLESLEVSGMVERKRLGGRGIYRRTQLGVIAANELLLMEDLGFSKTIASEETMVQWKPEPGAPERLDELIGQESAKYMIRKNLDYAKRSGDFPAGMLIYGPSGIGKTMIGGIISLELGIPFIPLSMADTTYIELSDAVEMAQEGAVLFLDELQAAPKKLKDFLLVAFDPSKAREFVAIAATTDPGALSLPLRRRFPLEIPLSEYNLEEAEALTRLRARGMGLQLEPGASFAIARAARSNPAKIAKLLMEAQMLGDGSSAIAANEFHSHLRRTGRDPRGIDTNEVEILVFLRDEAMGPAGIGKLSEVLGLDEKFVSEKLRNLRREGLVQNMGRSGHAVTSQGRNYLAENCH
jgi:holliday junction DNA helicase RuvB